MISCVPTKLNTQECLVYKHVSLMNIMNVPVSHSRRDVDFLCGKEGDKSDVVLVRVTISK